MSSRKILSGGNVVLFEGIMHGGAVVMEGSVIVSVCHQSEVEHRDSDVMIDCTDCYICPGFIDLHNQGGGGFTVMDGSEEHTFGMCRAHAAHGTTGLLLTPAIEMDTRETLLPALAATVGKNTGGAAVLGIHAEGPYLSPKRQGCMPDSGMGMPDKDDLRRILDLGNGTIREMTIAPELPGAQDCILTLAREKVTPSLGHSDATLNDVLRAIDHGAMHVTHFFNAMSPINHREPGLAGAALYSPDLTVEVIADGFHIHPWVLGLTVQNKGIGRTCLITDSMSVMGLDDGDYEALGQNIRLENGRVSLVDDSSVLAGSVLSQDRAVANMVGMVGFSLSDAVTMASAVPASVIGLDQRKGRLQEGYDADIAVLDKQYRNCMTIVGGETVFNSLS